MQKKKTHWEPAALLIWRTLWHNIRNFLQKSPQQTPRSWMELKHNIAVVHGIGIANKQTIPCDWGEV